MHLRKDLAEELVEVDHEGHAAIFQTRHDNRQVAVKTIRVYMNSDFGKCHSVNILTAVCSKRPLITGFVEILSRGCCMEASPAPKHLAITWRGSGRTPTLDDI